MSKTKVTLSSVLRVQSSSRNYKEMALFILDRINAIDPKIKVSADEHGNIYAAKGEVDNNNTFFPAFACHTDTVHNIIEGYKIARTKKNHLWFAYKIEKDGTIDQLGIGGDDKCGIFICLRLLEKLDVVKCAFFADEEMGCVGSNKADLKWFNDCRYVIQVDRQTRVECPTNDLVFEASQVPLASASFMHDVRKLAKEFEYKEVHGGLTDVVALKRNGLGISCMNMSVGYYAPHSDYEIVSTAKLLTAFNFCMSIAKICTSKYPHFFGNNVVKLHAENNEKKIKPASLLKSKTCGMPGCNRQRGWAIICSMCVARHTGQTKCNGCRKAVYTAEGILYGLCSACLGRLHPERLSRRGWHEFN